MVEKIVDIYNFQCYLKKIEDIFAKVKAASECEHKAYEAVKSIGFRKKPKSICKQNSNSKQRREWHAFVNKRQDIMARHDTAKAQYVVIRGKYEQQKQEFDNFMVNLLGVPEIYRKNTSVSICEVEYCVNVLFGLPGLPLNIEHGHYAIYFSGYIKYRREFGDPHGPQNHSNFERKPELSCN